MNVLHDSTTAGSKLPPIVQRLQSESNSGSSIKKKKKKKKKTGQYVTINLTQPPISIDESQPFFCRLGSLRRALGRAAPATSPPFRDGCRTGCAYVSSTGQGSSGTRLFGGIGIVKVPLAYTSFISYALEAISGERGGGRGEKKKKKAYPRGTCRPM